MSSNQHNQNDIDQILNEVEELRKELSSEAEAVDIEAVAKEMADVLSEVEAPSQSPASAPASVPTSGAPVTPSTPAASALPATPTLAQATEVANELAAFAEAAIHESPLDAPVSACVADPIEKSADDLMKEFQASLDAGEAGEVAEAAESAVAGDTSDFPHAEESMESTLAEYKDDPSVKTLLDETFDDQARRQVEKEAPVMSNSDNNESNPSLTMSLTGSMTLKLKYEFAGQEVTVGFTDEFLKVELADGTEFKIPVGRQKSLRRVA